MLSAGDVRLLATFPSGSFRVERLKSCSDLSRMSSSHIPPISADPVPFLRLQKQCRVGAGFPASPGNVFRWMALACSQDALGRCSHTGMHADAIRGRLGGAEIDVP